MYQKSLVLRDEVHGDMMFHGVLRHIIDHAGFQRLRSIKQLGLAEYVFPCATHTRFQHCLGAAFLAGKYFEDLVELWAENPIRIQEPYGTTFLETERTSSLCQEVSWHEASYTFWKEVAMMAALLHDVGHGPLSHTFECLPLDQNFSEAISKTTGTVGKYLADARKRGPLMHEDISLLYISWILGDLVDSGWIERPLGEAYTIAVSGLVNRKAASGVWTEPFDAEVGAALRKIKILGGSGFHRILRPLISGPFDVDRLDYIQRDGRNCGVPAGGIEWRRIVTRVVPCLARYPNDLGEPEDVVLLSNMRNQHVLDDFVFSLFQMYTQLYLHPKIVAMEEEIKRLLETKSRVGTFCLTLDSHLSLTDESFVEMLRRDLGVPEIGAVLRRLPGYHFDVASFSEGTDLGQEYARRGYVPLKMQVRPMLKDSLGVFLYHSPVEGDAPAAGTQQTLVRPWTQVSPLANRFKAISYAPEIWVCRRGEGSSVS